MPSLGRLTSTPILSPARRLVRSDRSRRSAVRLAIVSVAVVGLVNFADPTAAFAAGRLTITTPTASLALDQSSTTYGATVTAHVVVVDDTQAPVPNIAVMIYVRPNPLLSPTAVPTSLDATTGPDGRVAVALLPHAASWLVSVAVVDVGVETTPIPLTVLPAPITVTASSSAQVVTSRARATLTVQLRSPTAVFAQLVLGHVVVRAQTLPDKNFYPVVPVGQTLLGPLGASATVTVRPWRTTTYRVTYGGNSDFVSPTTTVTVATRGELPMVSSEPSRSSPRVRYPIGLPPVGTDAHATVTVIPNAVWTSMVGVSWRPGCTSRSNLLLVSVNYFGFDGYTYRGQIIVRRTIAHRVADAFTQLYRQHFRIRSIFLPDRFGRSSVGPGANDYAQMRADNTSGFNCRYIDGSEAWRVWSAHAAGVALDINPWENPYLVGHLQLPDHYFAGHRAALPGVLTGTGSAAVRDFTARGASWGGTWGLKDFQHFQW